LLFFQKNFVLSCFFFDFRSIPKFQIFTPHTPSTLHAAAARKRQRETQKARGSIVDTLSPPRFDFFGARGVVFFSELYLSTFWKSELEKGTRAHTQLRRRF